MLSSWSKTFNS